MEKQRGEHVNHIGHPEAALSFRERQCVLSRVLKSYEHD